MAEKLRRTKMENTYKKLILFTKDEDLKKVLSESLGVELVFSYQYDADLDNIDFSNTVTVLDYDAEGESPEALLVALSMRAGISNKVVVVSKNCERKIVADCAKKGAARFIVKPLTKKRFKRFLLPYFIDTAETVSDEAENILLNETINES
jgi:FixJ family two-component response regulator